MPNSHVIYGPERRGPDIPPVPPLQGYPTPPPPPVPPVVISGLVDVDGGPGVGVAVAFTGLSSVYTDSFGAYYGTVPTGWSGTVDLPAYSNPLSYTVTPTNRIYVAVASNQPNQDFDVVSNLYYITGQVTSEGVGVDNITLSDGATVTTTDIDGTYSYEYLGGWSGTLTPSYISSPANRQYVSVAADISYQDFESPPPFIIVAANYFSWAWTLDNPNRWFIVGKNPIDSTLSVVGTVAGVATGYYVGTNTGTFYSIYGASAASSQVTFRSNEVWTSPPLPPVHVIEGQVTDMSGPMPGVDVEMTGFGTLSTDMSGMYSQIVIDGYSGTVIPHSASGSFTPEYRTYINVTSDYYSQDYSFSTYAPLPVVISGRASLNGEYDTNTIKIAFSGDGTAWSDVFNGGYYAGTMPYGWSGTTTVLDYVGVRYTTTPAARVYSGITTDQNFQDFAVVINWASVGGTVVDQNGTGIQVTIYNGTDTWQTASNGSYGFYTPWGWSGTITPYASGGTFVPQVIVETHLTGDNFHRDFTFYGTHLEVSGSVHSDGTLVTLDNNLVSITTSGSYGFYAPYGWSGVTTPEAIDGGTFSPASRSYVSITASQLNQDFTFVGTAAPPTPTDCPVPGTNVDIPLPNPNNASRNVIDPVNNLLWVIDESYTNVYYVDVVAGTYAGSVDVSSPYGVATVGYDRTNKKILCTTYDGSLAFIDPATKAVTFSDFVQRWPGFHMLAVTDSGTAFVCDNRQAYGYLYMVDCATEKLINRYFLDGGGANPVYTDSIAFAENIGKLVLMSSRPFNQWFFVFDPATGVFTPSVLQTTASFNYENYYVRATGHMLMTRQGWTAAEVVDISLAENGTIITSLAGAPNRVSDATEDTCTNHLFVSDGNYAIYEYTLDGNYSLINMFDNGGAGVDPTGLAHSRATNLVYYEQWSGSPIPVKSIQATRSEISVGDMVWAVGVTGNGNFAGTAWAVGGDGTYWSTAWGDDANPYQAFNATFDTHAINLQAPYPATLRVTYTGSQWHAGTEDYANYDYGYISINGAAAWASYTVQTDGSFGGILEAAGTINTGYNPLSLSFTNQTGACWTTPPAQFYCTVSATIEVRPLTHP